MHRLLVTYPQPAEPAAFMDHYVGHHLPLASTLPGLLACRYARPALLGPGDAPFVLFEADFASEAALFEALGSDIGARVAADVPNYSPGGATLMHYAVADPASQGNVALPLSLIPAGDGRREAASLGR